MKFETWLAWTNELNKKANIEDIMKWKFIVSIQSECVQGVNSL